MKALFTKTLAVLLSAMLLFTAFPLAASAAITEQSVGTSSGTSGDCTWTLDNGTLTISGNGAMGNYDSKYYNGSYITSAPWGANIKSVVIKNGVTGVGKYSFYGCTGLKSVTIPDSVTSIGDYAFGYCTGLTSVTIPDSVTSIGDWAFSGCTGLTGVYITDLAAWCNIKFDRYSSNPLYYAHNLYLNNQLVTDLVIPDGVTSIGSSTFEGCTGLTNVTIGNSVTSIGKYAFEDCTGLESVTIGNSVISIGSSAFYGCKWLTSVTIPDSVTSIGSSAFYGCKWLTSVTIPDSVTSIGDWAFEGCTGLESVTIGNSVTSIGEQAFFDCIELTSIIIPDNVKSIGEQAFGYIKTDNYFLYNYRFTIYGIRGSEAENYANNNSIYFVRLNEVDTTGDCTWTVDNEGTLTISGNGPMGRYTSSYDLPWGTGIKTVVIENGVTSIGGSAFWYCSRLRSITIPNSVKSIGSYAFYGCNVLRSVTIPNSVTSIGSYAFGYRYSYDDEGYLPSESNINANNSTIISQFTIYSVKGSEAENYSNNNSINFVRLYEVCTTGDCTWELDGEGTLTISGNGAMSNYAYNSALPWGTGIKRIIIEDGVTSIGNYAFNGCTGLTDITIPDSVTSIGDYAFYNCTGLKSVTIPDSVTSIGDYAFEYCTGLTSITIPDSVTSIGDWAFSGCTGLTGVYITDLAAWCNIKFDRYSSNPLYYTHNLYLNNQLVTDLEIPDSVTSIGNYAFSGCTGLTSVNTGDSVTSIGDSAFYACTGLTSVNTGDSVTNIGDSAFYACTGLTNVTIGNSVTSIGKSAFEGCTELTSITIPDSVTRIEEQAFGYYFSYDNNVDYPYKKILWFTICGLKGSEAEKYAIANNIPFVEIERIITGTTGGCEWSLDSNGKLTISGNGAIEDFGSDSALPWGTEIKSAAIKDGVTGIGKNAFRGCKELESVKIPGSVKSIGDSAFYGSDSLTDVCITDLAAWCNIDFGVSSANPVSVAHKLVLNDKPVTSLDIPDGVTSVGTRAFSGCSELTSLTVPASVTNIEDWAFYGCTNLTDIKVDEANSVYDSRGNCNAIIDSKSNSLILGFKTTVIPDSVTSIAARAFNGCAGLTGITIPEGVTGIGDRAFSGCTGLTEITVPGSVNKLDNYAFYGCTGLTTATLDSGVKSIGDRAFQGCKELTSITIPYSVESIGGHVFDSCGEGLTIYGYSGSAAEEYAKNNNIKFESVGEAPAKTGDMDGDAVINGKDAAVLARYTSGWDGYADKVNLDAADINGDGKVNGMDSAILMRYTSGWDGYDHYFI